MSALREIFITLKATLAGDSQLTAILAPSILGGGPGVFNDVPANQPYPHIEIGTAPTRESNWDHFGGFLGEGHDAKVPVHIWSQYQGDDEALRIHDRVMALLHNQPLAIGAFSTVICERDDTRGLKEMVNKVETRHFIDVFRFRVT